MYVCLCHSLSLSDKVLGIQGWPWTCYVPGVDLFLLSPAPKFWDYKCMLPCSLYKVLGSNQCLMPAGKWDSASSWASSVLQIRATSTEVLSHCLPFLTLCPNHTDLGGRVMIWAQAIWHHRRLPDATDSAQGRRMVPSNCQKLGSVLFPILSSRTSRVIGGGEGWNTFQLFHFMFC